MSKERVGGGTKKVLYTLGTVNRIGLRKSTKALMSKNTCKACALGMGGQAGGMTNELGEFPSVCNKSVQAQSTDIQAPIPLEVFDHTVAEFRELTAKEIENLGRLNTPIFKAAGSNRYVPITWDEAYEIGVKRLKATNPDRSFFYSSGRSANEAAFVFQLLARVYGTNNISNCSYYCHQATGVGLKSTIGTGTATVELADLGKCDLFFLIGANPSSNHPRLIHQLASVRERGGNIIVINPAKEPGLVKFAIPKKPQSMLKGGTEIASEYVQPRIGQDLALLKGLAKAVLETGAHNPEFIEKHCKNFSGWRADIENLPWEEIESRSGVSKGRIFEIAKIYAQSESTVFAWGMGMTHHLHGVQNVEAIACLSLLRGMIGMPGAGLLPLRGHSNVQGVGTNGVKPVLADEVIAKMEDRFGFKFPPAKGLDTMASLQSAHKGDVDAAVIMGGNLYAASPNSDWAAEALDKIGFKMFLTTTLNLGHVTGVDAGESLILPVTARDEEWDSTTQESMFNYVRLSDGGINRLDNVRPESHILADLGAALTPGGPIDFQSFKKHQTTREAIAAIVPGMEALKDISVAREEFHIRNRLLHAPDFNTESGKASFQVTPLPDNRPAEGQFVLTTLRSEGQFNSIVYEEKDSYRGTETRWCIMMNPEDILKMGIEPGQYVDVRSENGVMENVKVYAYGVPSGDVMAYYPEANILVGTGVDPRSHTPGFKSTFVSVRPSD